MPLSPTCAVKLEPGAACPAIPPERHNKKFCQGIDKAAGGVYYNYKIKQIFNCLREQEAYPDEKEL